MSRKNIFTWDTGAEIDDHSRRKLKILREYFHKYLSVRCVVPQQTKFRLAVVDGFSGAGRYTCGTAGSPIIFLEEAIKAFRQISVERQIQGMATINMEIYFVFNDANRDAISILREQCAPLVLEVKDSCSGLDVKIDYESGIFEDIYPSIKKRISDMRFGNIIYNLDQCGNSLVRRNTIIDIINSGKSVEIIFTFLVQTLISFLRKADQVYLEKQLSPFGITNKDITAPDSVMSKHEWLAAVEKMVFESYQKCAPYVTPFSVNHEKGWKYWLIHFAKFYRARQVYNDILHKNSSFQAHFGRSGLDMLAYDKRHESGSLYLFDLAGRDRSREQLIHDIPQVILDSGSSVPVGLFYEKIYNSTPAHSDDINRAIIDSCDLDVITKNGGVRRSQNSIRVDDIIKVKDQRSFFFTKAT